MPIGVNQLSRALHHAHMAWPKDQIAALQIIMVAERRSKFFFLFSRVARGGNTTSVQRQLYQA